MVEAILPPLIRQEQKLVLSGKKSGLDVSIKRFVSNLSYFQEYLTVIAVDPLSGEAIRNSSGNFNNNQTEAIKYLQEYQDLTPLPVEVLANSTTGRPELIGEIFIVENPYRTQINLLRTSTIVFTILVFCYLLYTLKDNDIKQKIQLQLQEQERRDQQQKQEKLQLELMYQKQQLKLMSVHAMNDALRHIVETEFSSPLSNRLQELDNLIESTLMRIQTATQDIIHDVRKAPLLTCDERIRLALADLEILDANQQAKVFKDIKNYLFDAKHTVETANWVLNNLQELTSLESTEVCLQKQLQDFFQYRPPSLQSLEVNFEDSNQQFWIQCNAVHFKSIVKNILYNSSAAIKKHNRELKKQGITPAQGKISICCTQQEQVAEVTIEDNGPGIPKELIERLYQVPERLNQSRGNLEGNGNLIVYAYTKLHRGTVKVENRAEGGGARVRVSFPLASPPDRSV